MHGECVATECSGSSPPCPAGEISTSGTYELDGVCMDCPDNTIESCVELLQCSSVAPSVFPSDFPSSNPSSYPSTTPTTTPSKAPRAAPSQQNTNDSKDVNLDRNLPPDIDTRIFGICRIYVLP